MRQTSLEAYKEILPELGKRQQMVLSIISKYQPCTDQQIAHFSKMPINCITPRRGELVKKGLIKEHDIIKNQWNRNATRWKLS